MTSAAAGPPTAGTSRPHPLEPLGLDELARVTALLRETELPSSARFVEVSVAEPEKGGAPAAERVTGAEPGKPGGLGAEAERAGAPAPDFPPRRARVVLLDAATGRASEALVCLTTERVLEHAEAKPEAGATGLPPILLEEFELVERIVKADPGWRAAVEARGVADPELALIAPLAAGAPAQPQRRVVNALTYMRADQEEMNPYARPVEGLVAVVDLVERAVVDLLDESDGQPIPRAPGEFHEGAWGPPRRTLTPLEITQPEGPSFQVDGHAVEWERWRLRLSWNAREGLVLHALGFQDGERLRPILHRASIAEMVVPYADPRPAHSWRGVFDVGEYGLGRMANSLELGCDCVGLIHYFDAAMVAPDGEPYTLPNAICMHEEDVGVLWKHTDDATGRAEVRRSRRLVLSFFATVGNYDYGFYWYLYLDGTIELEVKLTGILLTGGGLPEHATAVAPGVDAAYHQHLFCARLDLDVDGERNSVYEVDLQCLPRGDANPAGNAFTTTSTRLDRERVAARDAAPERGRYWQVANERSAAAYKLVPQPGPTLLADPDSQVARRAAFATHHLWVTPHDPDERFPAGEYPNQHPGGAGLPSWTGRDRSLVDTDVVLWHTFGTTHLPRPEDWPVMPVERTGFALKPAGFFERNPALDLAAPAVHACGAGLSPDPSPAPGGP